MRRIGNVLTALAAGAAMLLPALPAQADPVADFYRGRTLRMLVGYGPGGGYDIYGRLVAEFLPRHLPGNPTIVAQNMPGAGSFVAARQIYETAPKDGTVFGSLAQTLALDSMTNTATKIDVTKFNYLGRVVTNIDTGVTLPKSGIKSFEDSTRNLLDLSAVPNVKGQSHLPIIVDPSHATGRPDLIPSMARAALAAGADGVHVEVHSCPEKALSDGPQALLPSQYAALLKDLRRLADLIGKTF